MSRMPSDIEKKATGQEEKVMRINYEAKDRKRMVKAIGKALDEKPVYQGVPSCAYQIAEFTVTRDGDLEFPDDTDPEIINGLLNALEEAGFAFPEDAQASEEFTDSVETEAYTDDANSMTTEASTEGEMAETAKADELEELTISLPTMESVALERLQKLVDGKASLIRKALDTDQLIIRIDGDKVSFPWWNHMPTPDEAAAYMAFLAAMCRMARDAKRVIATEKPVESEKYSFRIFLIRLGFNGKENAAVRKTLLHRLSGSAAFRNAEEERKFREHRKALKVAAQLADQEVAADETAE